jgi:transcriptional regulator with XRE-family HTH domain
MFWSMWSKEPLPRVKPVNEQRLHKMLRLRAKGLTFREIAEQLGVSHQLVQHVLKLSGNSRLVPICCRECKAAIAQMRTAYDKNIPAWCLECLAKHPEAAFGQRLKAHRLASGMTRGELAKKAGAGKASVIEYELGNKLPTLENLTKLIRVLGAGLVVSGLGLHGHTSLPTLGDL